MTQIARALSAVIVLVTPVVLSARAQAVAANPVPARILFIGNSYTGVNNLPKLFQAIVVSAGVKPPTVKAATPGGRSLERHLTEKETLRLIDEGNWDVVILQGQSQEAALAEVSANARASFLRGARGLCQRIKATSPTVRIVFYETWARHADYWKAANAEISVGRNPSEMQARNRKWYQQAAAQHADCVVAPVGDAWELNYKSPTAVRLHHDDHSHPAFNGSYLAGLVIYGVIYHPAKLSVPYRGDLSATEAAYLQRLAAQVIPPAAR